MKILGVKPFSFNYVTYDGCKFLIFCVLVFDLKLYWLDVSGIEE
jgi:hypothetical protein